MQSFFVGLAGLKADDEVFLVVDEVLQCGVLLRVPGMQPLGQSGRVQGGAGVFDGDGILEDDLDDLLGVCLQEVCQLSEAI